MAGKVAAPKRPLALRAKAYKAAWWDASASLWRDGDYWYDVKAADAAVRFFATRLKLTEGEWAGKPFILEDWQEHDIVRPLFGWKRADGARRYRRCYIWVARKNGKTELAAGLALLMLMGDGEMGGQVFSIASEKEQASIVFNKATAMVAYSPFLGEHLDTLKTAIYCQSLNGSFRPLSGKPQGKHGLNMSGLVGDEIHEWKSPDLYTFVHDSAAARRQPLEILISTAGVKGTHGEEVWDECQQLLNGEIEDPATMVVVYAADADDDWTKEETWRKANPNWGKSVKTDTFAEEFKRARQLPRLEADFRRYKLNQWTDQDVRWLPINSMDDEGRPFGWDHCIGPVDWKDLRLRLKGLRCFGGLDLSAVQDLSALSWWFPIQPGLDTPVWLPRFWKPRDLLKAHEERDKVPYRKMVEEGSLQTTPGNVIDHQAIRAQVLADAEFFQIAFINEKRETNQGGLAVDRFDATETIVRLNDENIPALPFGQGFVSMSGPAKELERLVLANAFHHGGHPLLRRHAQAVAVETDAAGNIKPSKAKSTQRIDGIVSGVMAIGISAQDVPPKVHPLERHGVRRI